MRRDFRAIFKKIFKFLEYKRLIFQSVVFLFFCSSLTAIFFSSSNFHIEDIQPSLPYHEEWQTGVFEPVFFNELNSFFNQRFSYLGEGAQCMAFASDDQKCVIKFLRSSHVRPQKFSRFYADRLSFNNLATQEHRARIKKEKWTQKLIDTCNRYTMAFKELKSETGLIFVHFNKTSHLNVCLKLIDKKGRPHEIDLDQAYFILQKRADLLPARIEQALQKRDIESAKKAIFALYTLFVERAKKGFTDQRQCLSVNFGLVGNEAIQIDVGKISKNEELIKMPLKEIQKISANLKNWTARHYPELFQETAYQLEELDKSLFF